MTATPAKKEKDCGWLGGGGGVRRGSTMQTSLGSLVSFHMANNGEMRTQDQTDMAICLSLSLLIAMLL